MRTLIDHFNVLYPAYAAQRVQGRLRVDEMEAEDKEHYVRRLLIDNFDGWQIPHHISKTNTELYQKCQTGGPSGKDCHELVRKDCDGLLTYETPKAHVIIAVEIKTSFSQDDILNAVRQIIGSIRKLEAMMSILQGFDSSRVKHKGIIVSRDPSTAQISAWKNLTDPKTRLLTHLARKRPKTLHRAELEALYHPLQLRDIELQHIAVAPASKEAMADALALKSSWQS